MFYLQNKQNTPIDIPNNDICHRDLYSSLRNHHLYAKMVEISMNIPKETQMVRKYKLAAILAAMMVAILACSLGGEDGGSSGGSGLPADILFQDDFSDTSSGWDRVNEVEGITDYSNGVYRILVNTDNTDVWANPGLNLSDTIIEVDASKIGGADDNDLGIVCRYQDVSNFYFFIISSDGFYGIAKVIDGEQDLIDLENMEYSDSINQGNATNKLRADCVGDNLVLWVNGQKLMDVNDSQYSSGDVGLIAGTFDTAGTDIHFDNFVVKKP